MLKYFTIEFKCNEPSNLDHIQGHDIFLGQTEVENFVKNENSLVILCDSFFKNNNKFDKIEYI